MSSRKWFVVSASLLLGIILVGVAVHWWFNGNTRPFNVSGELHSVHGETGEVTFHREITFVAPSFVKLSNRPDSNEALKSTIIVETTANGFKWKNTGNAANSDGKLDWNAHGRISKEETERLGHRWFAISWLQLW